MFAPLQQVPYRPDDPDLIAGYDLDRLRVFATQLSQVSTLLIDMDGVLLDDQHLFEISVRALAHLGLKIPMEQVVVEGKLSAPFSTLDMNLQHLAKKHGKDLPIDEVRAAIEKGTDEVKNRNNGRLPAHVCISYDVLRYISDHYYFGLVTSRDRESALRILKDQRIVEYFDIVVTRDDIRRIKPEPEGLHAALAALQHPGAPILSQNCVYMGDMHTDMRAAVAAGMHPVGVIAPMDRGVPEAAARSLYDAGALIVLRTPMTFIDLKKKLEDLTRY